MKAEESDDQHFFQEMAEAAATNKQGGAVVLPWGNTGLASALSPPFSIGGEWGSDRWASINFGVGCWFLIEKRAPHEAKKKLRLPFVCKRAEPGARPGPGRDFCMAPTDKQPKGISSTQFYDRTRQRAAPHHTTKQAAHRLVLPRLILSMAPQLARRDLVAMAATISLSVCHGRDRLPRALGVSLLQTRG